ncbi:YcxB family protein [Roseiflexus sp. RS-1]|jgi:hypothetical protein|uniref:YcxB family protein n=1 Tax=Roseiflexus sp. (strain RS-1) TaxID=357808 RepID=UPI0000D8191D|nr:YcxB family protein [Roseiflexus sp. RS-1]ABQ92357.1 hypothetical protein RoseRS_4012 [Roseiflexus sp. RS-1]
MTATTASSFTLNYTHTLDEQLHACRLYQRSTRKHLIYRSIGFLAIFGGVWIAITSGVNPQALLLLALGLFTWFDPVPLLIVWSTFRSSPPLRQTVEAMFDQRGAHFRFGTERVSRPWDRYLSFVESDRVFVLIHGRWAYSVVPKRAFASPQAIDAFRELLRAKIRPSTQNR